MTDIDQGVELELDEEPAPGRGKLKLYGLIAAGVIVLGLAGGSAWYYLLGGKAHFVSTDPKKIEAPLPYFLDLKPFVVTVESRNGPSRFVQLGLSFQLTSSAAGEMITAILPKVQDTLRQAVLTYKSEDLQSPDGLNKVRAAMLSHLNRMLAQVLGEERIKRASAGKPKGGPLVEDMFFSTLVVE